VHHIRSYHICHVHSYQATPYLATSFHTKPGLNKLSPTTSHQTMSHSTSTTSYCASLMPQSAKPHPVIQAMPFSIPGFRDLENQGPQMSVFQGYQILEC
jgi:hypothetical protein